MQKLQRGAVELFGSSCTEVGEGQVALKLVRGSNTDVSEGGVLYGT